MWIGVRPGSKQAKGNKGSSLAGQTNERAKARGLQHWYRRRRKLGQTRHSPTHKQPVSGRSSASRACDTCGIVERAASVSRVPISCNRTRRNVKAEWVTNGSKTSQQRVRGKLFVSLRLACMGCPVALCGRVVITALCHRSAAASAIPSGRYRS